MSSPRLGPDNFVKGLRGSTEAETSVYEQMRQAYTNRGAKKPGSRNTRSNSAQGDQIQGLKKEVKKKEIMKLTIMNPSFKNETVIYNRQTPEKKHDIMSEQHALLSSKNSVYSSQVSKRRSKHDRKLGFNGSFGGQ